MIIFFNEKVRYDPWGGGAHFLNGFVDFLTEKGHKVVFKLKKNIDLIFILSNSYVEYDKKTLPIFKFKNKYPNVKIIHRINVSDISKGTNNVSALVFRSNSIADKTIFISNWLANYYIEQGFNQPYKVIYNGCNQKYFFPEENKILGNVINLVTHHWSGNWMKGFDIYNELDKILEERDDFTFSYIGRYFEGYVPKNIKVISPLYGEKLGEELRKYDIYITASRWEGCGMHHIEGASCGLPVLYHKDGGGINESCQHYGIEYNNVITLMDGIFKIRASYNDYRNKIPYKYLSIERCCEDYYKIILELFP